MTDIDRESKRRIDRAVRWAETQYNRPPETGPRYYNTSKVASWWGVTKAVIDNKAIGDVYLLEGAGENPTTTGLTTYWPVGNPWMGKLIIGMPVFVSQSMYRGHTGTAFWYVTPFQLIYEGKVSTGGSIVAGGSGTVDLWEADAAISPAVTVTAYHRWTANIDLTAGTKVRLAWDIKLRRFIVDTWLCP